MSEDKDTLFKLTQDYLWEHPEQRLKILPFLLSYIGDELAKIETEGIRQNQIQNDDNNTYLVTVIDSHIDLDDTILDNLITTLENNPSVFASSAEWDSSESGLSEKYENYSLWNESLNKILVNYLRNFDAKIRDTFETDSKDTTDPKKPIFWGIYEDEEGSISLESINGVIQPHGGAAFRLKDLKDADAGASFQENVHVTTSKVGFFQVVHPWVVPWYNINGDSYSKVRGEDKNLSALTNSNNLQYTNNQGKADQFVIRLLMFGSERTVQIEDLNRNFWVIAQALTIMCITLFDEDGVIMKTLEGLLNEIGQLWENMLYLWTALTTVSIKQKYEGLHIEVVPIPNSELQSYLKYDNFGKSNGLNSSPTDKQLKEFFEKRCNYLIKTYSNTNLLVVPYIKVNNYEKNYFSKIELYGYLTYDRNKNDPYILHKFTSKQTINIENYKSQLYGLSEISNTTYNYKCPFEKITFDENTSDMIYYALVRFIFNITASYTEQGISVSKMAIELSDVAKEIVTKQKSAIKTINLVPFNNDSTSLSNSTENTSGEIAIEKGFYQGEILSFWKKKEASNGKST